MLWHFAAVGLINALTASVTKIFYTRDGLNARKTNNFLTLKKTSIIFFLWNLVCITLYLPFYFAIVNFQLFIVVYIKCVHIAFFPFTRCKIVLRTVRSGQNINQLK